eukprot:2690173-Alexandrium_andersonii.AAC.1
MCCFRVACVTALLWIAGVPPEACSLQDLRTEPAVRKRCLRWSVPEWLRHVMASEGVATQEHPNDVDLKAFPRELQIVAVVAVRSGECWSPLVPWGPEASLQHQFWHEPVSYTHLTLPTICRV